LCFLRLKNKFLDSALSKASIIKESNGDLTIFNISVVLQTFWCMAVIFLFFNVCEILCKAWTFDLLRSDLVYGWVPASMFLCSTLSKSMMVKSKSGWT
jgi:hypothetical protein